MYGCSRNGKEFWTLQKESYKQNHEGVKKTSKWYMDKGIS